MSTRAIISMVLAWLVPGGGHFYLGLRRRAAAYFAIIATMFLLGVSIDGTLYAIREAGGSILYTLSSLGSMGGGAMYFIGLARGPHGSISSATFEYGRMFTLSAGLMNVLLVLDCWDLARGKKK